MAQLIIKFNSPITFGKNKMTSQEYFNLLKKQTILNYEKIISTKTSNDLDFYLPQMFNHILAAVTSINQFLLNFNLFLQKEISKTNNDEKYKKIVLNTIFAHHNLSRQDEFDNKLSSQFNYLFNILGSWELEEKNSKRLKEIAILFTMVENLFRHHEAHGLSGSLIDFFRGYNTGIYPAFILKDEYFKEFNSFASLTDKFCFTCPEEEFNNFFKIVETIIKDISNYEDKNSTKIINQKMKNSLMNMFTFSYSKINSIEKKDLNPFSFEMDVKELNKRFLFVRSDIMRSYFKYYSLTWNNDIVAHDINEIENALSINFYKFISDSNILFSHQLSITPENLLIYFKEFVDIIEKKLFDTN